MPWPRVVSALLRPQRGTSRAGPASRASAGVRSVAGAKNPLTAAIPTLAALPASHHQTVGKAGHAVFRQRLGRPKRSQRAVRTLP